MILSKLAVERVSTRWAVRDPRLPTGASVFISSHDRDAVIFTFRGANTLLEPADLREDAFGVDLVYVASLSNESADCFAEIIAKAKANGAFVATNPGIRQITSRPEPVLEALPHIDVLTLNRKEADALVPVLVGRFGEGGPALPLKNGERPPPLLARGLSGGGFEMSLARFFAVLHELGLMRGVITDGAAGAVAFSNSHILHCPSLAVTVAGTAGAGDAFGATCAAFLAQGSPIGEALKAGIVNAGSVIGYADTQTGLLTLEALQAQIGTAGRGLRLREWKTPEMAGA
jgi:ribokinase